MFVLLVGLASFATATGQLLELMAKEKKQLKSIRLSLGAAASGEHRHVLVIGDPRRTQARAFLKEFFHPDHLPHCQRQVVFLLPRPRSDLVELLRDPNTPWSGFAQLLTGSPAKDVDLYRAAAEKAAAIFVIPRRGQSAGRTEDRANLLRILRIKRYISHIAEQQMLEESSAELDSRGAVSCVRRGCSVCGCCCAASQSGGVDAEDDAVPEFAGAGPGADTAAGAAASAASSGPVFATTQLDEQHMDAGGSRAARGTADRHTPVNRLPRFIVAVQSSESRKFATACGLHEVGARDARDYGLMGHAACTPAVGTLVSNLVRSSSCTASSLDQAWAIEFKMGAECEVYTVSVDAALAGLTVERLAVERGEEAVAHRVVAGIADRPRRRADAGLFASQAERHGRALGSRAAMADDILRPSPADRHVRRVDDEPGLQVMAQPTIRREKASRATDRWMKPAQVGTYAMSAAQSWFGPAARKFRSTRSLAGRTRSSWHAFPRGD
jgi:hypothetical protein